MRQTVRWLFLLLLFLLLLLLESPLREAELESPYLLGSTVRTYDTERVDLEITVRCLLGPHALRPEVDRQGELAAELAGLAESKLCVAVATLRRLPVALQRILSSVAGELERLPCFVLK